MQKLVWQNAKGDEINLTQNPFGITQWEGFSNTGLNIQSQQVPFADGSVFLDALMEQRELSVTLAINDENDLYTRYELKRQLISALNPKLGEGYLIYTNDFISKRIKCVAQIPIFPTKNSDDAGTQKASLSWVACEPYWEDLEETGVDFGIDSQPVIDNKGDVPVQIKIDFFTSGVTNPKITNVTQNKFIKYNGVLSENLQISTEVGKKYFISEPISFDKLRAFGFYLYSVTYSETLGLFVAVGGDGAILTSPDGTTWARNSGVSTYLYSVTYSETLGLFVAGGEYGAILTSPDGTTWTERNSGVSTYLYSVTYSETLGLFVAVGQAGTILTSSDGTTWTRRTSGTSVNLQAVTYSETLGLFVAGGDLGTILTSSDGTTWTRRTSGVSTYLSSVTYSETLGLFVIVGQSGTILTSPDGTTWTERNSGVSTYLYSVTYSETLGLFVAVGQSGTILTSSDGTTWARRNSGVSVILQAVTYSETLGLFVAVGQSGTILTSSDGTTWTRRTSGVSVNLQAVTYSETLGLFVAGGDSGVILNSYFSLTENQIQNISEDSNANLKIEIGENKFRLNKTSGSFRARISYRQKYIGV